MDNQQFLYDELPQILNTIDKNAKAEWGLMTPHHMIEHLSLLVAFSNGKINAPSYFDEENQLKNKVFLQQEKVTFPKNFNATGNTKLMPLRFEDIEVSKQKLIESFHLFKNYFEENENQTANHPIFGKLNYEEWLIFHVNHVKHHLDQFKIKY